MEHVLLVSKDRIISSYILKDHISHDISSVGRVQSQFSSLLHELVGEAEQSLPSLSARMVYSTLVQLGEQILRNF